jgi:hypothetical protein
MTILAAVTDPDGREVVLTEDGWAHIAGGHSDLGLPPDAVLDVVRSPDHREDDPIAGRERFWRRNVGPSRWLRVVVDFAVQPAVIVTAFADRVDPKDWQP